MDNGQGPWEMGYGQHPREWGMASTLGNGVWPGPLEMKPRVRITVMVMVGQSAQSKERRRQSACTTQSRDELVSELGLY